MKKSLKVFAKRKKTLSLQPQFKGKIAKVAQLVEHNLAKVRVAGSNPVFRSNSKDTLETNWDKAYQNQ